jgi:hypothetical protein
MKGSRFSVPRLGWVVASVAAGAFAARAALAEPPSHGFNSRPPRPNPPVSKPVHPPHAPHKAHPLLAPGHKADHPTHVVKTRPPRENVKAPPPPAHPHNTPERLVVVKNPKEVIPHQPHVNQAPPVVNRAPVVHQPHQPHKGPAPVPQVSSGKEKVTQETIVVAPKAH